MPTKDRLLLLLQTLQEQSDEETWLTTADLRAALEKEGHECSVRTLRRDMISLQNCGYDIAVQESEGMLTKYAYLNREWSGPELQILVDAVSAGQFISADKTDRMIRKLRAMAGPSEREKLQPSIRTEERLKAPNEQILYIVQTIREAIDSNRRIVFKHDEYDAKAQLKPKHNGYEYEVSPYATIWQKDRYYLVGWSEKHNDIARFRIDRMEMPKLSRKKRRPMPESLHLEDHSDKIFSMFDGPEETVVLRCKPDLMNQIVDQFGAKPEILRRDTKSLDIQVTVHLSPTFYGWLFQYVGEMTVVAPEYVCQQYSEKMKQGLDEVLGN